MRKGFTLLEMIVVILIIAALFLLTIPNIQRVISIAQNKSCENQVKVVESAIVEYMILNDEVPSGIGQLIDEELLSEKQVKCPNGKQIYLTDGQAYVDE